MKGVVAIAALMTLCLAAYGVFPKLKAGLLSAPAAAPPHAGAIHVADASGPTIVSSSPGSSVLFSVARTRVAENTAATGSAAATAILGARLDTQTDGPSATGKRDGAVGAEAAAAPNVKDKNFAPSTISKAIVDEVSRLKDDATGWSEKLQELELDLKKNQQDVEATGKDIDRCLVVLRAAADRLAPGAVVRVIVRKQEVAVRDLAIRAELHLDAEIRRTAGYFQQKTIELHVLNRSIEETRTRLITQIDRLAKLKVQLEFNRGAGQVGESVKGGQASLDSIQAITATAQRFANDLDGFGRTPAVAIKPAEATNPAEARKRK